MPVFVRLVSFRCPRVVLKLRWSLLRMLNLMTFCFLYLLAVMSPLCHCQQKCLLNRSLFLDLIKKFGGWNIGWSWPTNDVAPSCVRVYIRNCILFLSCVACTNISCSVFALCKFTCNSCNCVSSMYWQNAHVYTEIPKSKHYTVFKSFRKCTS